MTLRAPIPHMLFLSSILFSSASNAIVQVNDAIDPEEGLSGNVRFTLNGQTGNKDEQEIGFDNLIQYRADSNLFVFIGDYSYSETNDVRDEDELFAHFRWVGLNRFENNVDAEIFVQYQYDDFADLSRRELLGGNVRFRKIQESSDSESLFIAGIGAFHEFEKSETTDLENELYRANLYFRYVYENKAEFPYDFYLTTYLQPAFEDISDLRGLAVGGIEFEILKNISVAFEVEVTHNSTPFVDIEKTDVDYGVSLKYQF